MAVLTFPKGTTFEIAHTPTYSVPIISMTIGGETVTETETATLADTYDKMADSGFRETEDVTVTIPYDPDNQPTLGGDDVAMTVTFPLRSGESTAGELAWNGYISAIGAATLERGGTRPTQQLTIRRNDPIVPVAPT